MDQVPLPFVVDQDTTYATHDDEHIQIRSCGAEGLTKRQYTMHIFINAGKGSDSCAYAELIARGQGKRISQVEREGWNKEVSPVIFQKCAWVDRPVMVKIAKNFVQRKQERHGDRPVLLICDNLDAHCCDKVLKIFGDANVFVFFVVPGCTDSIQPIDAGVGRLVRIYIGQALDDWLMCNDNLEKWESGFSASERRVLISNFLAAAMEQLKVNEEIRVSSFERTGCLLQLNPNEEEDSKVKPQGLRLPYLLPSALPTEMQSAQLQVAVPDIQLAASSVEDNVNNSISDELENRPHNASNDDSCEVDEPDEVVVCILERICGFIGEEIGIESVYALEECIDLAR